MQCLEEFQNSRHVHGFFREPELSFYIRLSIKSITNRVESRSLKYEWINPAVLKNQAADERRALLYSVLRINQYRLDKFCE